MEREIARETERDGKIVDGLIISEFQQEIAHFRIYVFFSNQVVHTTHIILLVLNTRGKHRGQFPHYSL